VCAYSVDSIRRDAKEETNGGEIFGKRWETGKNYSLVPL
jgi:hypothetical protein